LLLLLWLIATACLAARRRGRTGLAFAIPLAGVALLCYLSAVFAPETLRTGLIIASLTSLAAALGLVFWQGFR
jgi:hypothetical protein